MFSKSSDTVRPPLSGGQPEDCEITTQEAHSLLRTSSVFPFHVENPDAARTSSLTRASLLGRGLCLNLRTSFDSGTIMLTHVPGIVPGSGTLQGGWERPATIRAKASCHQNAAVDKLPWTNTAVETIVVCWKCKSPHDTEGMSAHQLMSWRSYVPDDASVRI